MKTFNYSLNLNHKYILKNYNSDKRLYIMLHGYLLSGELMFNFLNNAFTNHEALLSPDGPFLVPYKKQNEYYARFSWYFYNEKDDSFYISPKNATEYLKELVNSLNHTGPITIIGYSQGGYLAPLVAQSLANVDHVIGLACNFRENLFKIKPSITYDQIHGDKDIIVDYDNSLKSFERHKSNGARGNFYTLENQRHKVTPEFIEKLKEVIKKGP